MRKLAIFDIDGTIARQGIIDPAAIKGIKHLQSIGYTTTLCTGRGYYPMRKAIGDAFHEVVSDDALIVLEHGTRIVNKDGKTVFAEYLGFYEIEYIIEFIRANIDILRFSWYNPEEVTRKLQMWRKDPNDTDELNDKYSSHAEIFSSSLTDYKERLVKEKVTNIEARLASHVKVHNLKLALTHTPVNILFLDKNMSFLKNNINKGIAILYLLKHLDVAYEDLLVAGNAINDIEMLDLDAGRRILVGPAEERETVMSYLSNHESIITIDSPSDLGLYLQSFTFGG
ncbi:MAG: HAD-IIB family hydrolase [Candidatus Saccharibacteria bacterium]